MKTIKQNLFGFITIGICAAIMIYFVISTGGFGELWDLIIHSRMRWIFAALGAAIMVWMMESASFHAISIHVYDGWKFTHSFVSSMVGLLYCAVTPFSTGGQPMQIYSLHKKGMTTGAATAIVAVHSMVYQIGLVLFSLVMVILRLSYFSENVSGFAWLLILGLVVNVLYVTFLVLLILAPKTTDKIIHGLFMLLGKLHIFKNAEERYQKINTQLMLFHENISQLGRSVKMYFFSILFSFFQFVFQCLIPYFLYVACFYDKTIYVKEDILTVMAAQAFVLMVTFFVPTPGAAGGAEISFYGFFGNFYNKILTAANEAGRLVSENGGAYTQEEINSMASSKLAGTMFIWRFLSFYLTIIAGAVFVPLSERLKPLKLKNRLFDEEAVQQAEDTKIEEE
ncbi:MAG: flippase-like domain-containing protein [Clostridia bacterium]|nr:flippase-like domain-containing protein [Clostridia bacterium]